MSPAVTRAMLALLLAAADAALALGQEAPAAWALLALAPLALVVRPRLPAAVARVLTWTAWALAALVVARGDTLARPLGLALAVLATLFLTDAVRFPLSRAFLPAIIGLLLAAGSNPLAPHFTLGAWIAAAAIVLWLVSGLRLTRDPWRWLERATFLALAAAMAHGLIVFLPWAQPHVEQATVAYAFPNAAETGLAVGARLGDVASLALSHRVVMRMWSDHPANLRAGVFTRFDGHAWLAPRKPRAMLTLPPAPALVSPLASDDDPAIWCARSAAPPPSARFARLVATERLLGILPAPANVDAARGVSDYARLDRFGLLVAPARVVEDYAVRYVPGPQAETDDAEAQAECLELPPSPDPRLVALAAALARDAPSTPDKIRHTAAHLQTNYRYSLNVGAFATKDPVAEFLFDKKKGYCEYFASATVLLLRLQGVPARYVSGLSVRDANRLGDHYVVRGSDAHAWAEALVPGLGWVEVDSTPAGEYEDLHRPARGGRWEALLEAARSWWAELLSSVRTGGWSALGRRVAAGLRVVAPWLLVIAAFYAGRRWLRRRAARPAATPPPSIGVSPDLLAALRRLEAAWARAGYPRPPHRAPLEHARDAPADRIPPDLKALGLDVVGCFYRGAYGGEEIAPEDVARLARGLDDVSARIGN